MYIYRSRSVLRTKKEVDGASPVRSLCLGTSQVSSPPFLGKGFQSFPSSSPVPFPRLRPLPFSTARHGERKGKGREEKGRGGKGELFCKVMTAARERGGGGGTSSENCEKASRAKKERGRGKEVFPPSRKIKPPLQSTSARHFFPFRPSCRSNSVFGTWTAPSFFPRTPHNTTLF